MNLLFSFILIAAAVVYLATNPANFLAVMISGGTNGVNFALKLLPIYAIWLCVLQILTKNGLDTKLARVISPLTKRLFPKEGAEVYTFINLNLAANLLGMGGASTPLGIKAVENMQYRKNRVMLIVINSTSIQLIPTTVISMRSAAGSTTDILLASLVVTLATTVIGVLLVWVFER